MAATKTTVLDVPASQEEKDAYAVARRFFDSKEFERVAFTLIEFKSAQSRFLSYYSQYLAAEKQALNAFYKRDGTRQQPPVPQNLSLLKLLDAVGTTDDPFLLFLKGLLFQRVMRRAEALECLIRSINLYPWNWSAWLQLSACLEDQEEYVGIHKHLPAHVVTRIFAIRFMIELHSPGETDLKNIDSLLRLFPGSLYLMTQKALVYYHQRDFEAAEKAYDEIRKRDPYRIDDIDVFSNILYVMEKRTKLSKLAHEFLALDKDRPEVCCLVGNHYSLRAEHEKAVKYFRRAVQLDRTFLSAWTLMGHEFIEMKNSQAAVEAYRRAVDVNKKDYRGWYGLGQAYELLNMHNYALHYYQRGAALRPYDVRMWQAMGMCYQDLSRPREAISCFKRALLGSDARETSLNLKIAGLHDLLEERAEAAAYHRRCVELGTAEGRPISEFAKSCIYVARYHLFWGGGDLRLSKEYLEKVAGSNVEESTIAVEYLRKLRAGTH
ncbi:cell division control protein 23 [Ramaria rubella]|nr:cell division control protein 23 [Ramaria rubella]